MYSDVSLKFSNHCKEMTRQGQKQVGPELKLFKGRLRLVLDGQKPEEKVAHLEQEQDVIRQDLGKSQSKEYFDLLDDPDNLQKLFFVRLIFRGQQENDHYKAAIVRGEKYKFVSGLLAEARAQLSAWLVSDPGENHPRFAENGALYEPVFGQASQLGLRNRLETITEFKERQPLQGLSAKRTHSIVSGRLNKINTEFNGWKYPELYYLLNDPVALKSYFVAQCSQGADIEVLCHELQRVMCTQPMIGLLTRELLPLDEKALEKSLDALSCRQTMADILCSLAPGRETYEAFNALVCKSEQDLEKGKPVILIKIDINNAFKNIAHKAFCDLKTLLDHQSADRKYIYLKCILRDLHYKKIKAEGQGKDFRRYYEALIDFYESEWKYVKSLKIEGDFSFEDILSERQEGKKTTKLKKRPDPRSGSTKAVAFTYINKKGDYLSLVHKLLIELGAIPKETTVAELREFVNGKEMSKPLPWLAGLGDLMVFIKEAIRLGKLTCPHQQQWIITARGFVLADGSTINATSLKVAQPTNRADQFIKAAQLL